jgi:phosphoglycerol transferase MdoB-like AlkP superfamily enzyme
LTELENTDLEADRGVTRNIECLPDILHSAGYHQVFLGGADSRFSGKRNFLDAHGVDEVWGWERWSQLPRYAQRPNTWGLDDDDLVREAQAMLPALRKRGPFHLMLLTVNTHPPGFVTPGCPVAAGDSDLLNAVRCTDAAIGRLFDMLSRDGYLQDTVIEVMGDHMMFPSAENQTALGALSTGWFGRVFMSIAVPGLPARIIDTPSYTPDLAAIALDALGFNPVPGFAFGRSSLRTPIANRSLVARSFAVVDGQMLPSQPIPGQGCNIEQLSNTIIDDGDGISACEREKLIEMAERLTDQEE